jgi:hypothetical protein
MPLRSELFRGDKALESCLVNHQAHLVEGTRGPHVKKVQRALALLDGALIAVNEVSAGHYGASTAAAVLSYKRAREIINFSYQTTADNIVGKMTIAALDEEMAQAEARPPLSGCLDETRPSGRGRAAIDGKERLGEPALAGPPTTLRIAFQDALGTNEVGIATPTRVFLLSAKAQKLLLPFNLHLSTSFLGFFPFPFPIGHKDDIDVEGLRKAAQKASAGSDTTLRVIFCTFRPTTSTGVSHGRITGIEGFRNFVLLNKEKMHPDFGTLLHEMIHCSHDSLMFDSAHDGDTQSVFSSGAAASRNLLKREHAEALRKSFFA